MSRARGTAVMLAILACGLVIAALVLRPARAQPDLRGGMAAPGGNSPLRICPRCE
jgi:hypothetical protein